MLLFNEFMLWLGVELELSSWLSCKDLKISSSSMLSSSADDSSTIISESVSLWTTLIIHKHDDDNIKIIE